MGCSFCRSMWRVVIDTPIRCAGLELISRRRAVIWYWMPIGWWTWETRRWVPIPLPVLLLGRTLLLWSCGTTDWVVPSKRSASCTRSPVCWGLECQDPRKRLARVGASALCVSCQEHAREVLRRCGCSSRSARGPLGWCLRTSRGRSWSHTVAFVIL